MLSKRNSKYYEIGKLKVKDKEVFLININQILIKKKEQGILFPKEDMRISINPPPSNNHN